MMIAGLVSGVVGLLIFLVGGIITLAGFAFWLWMLVHAIGNKALTDGERIVWVLVIIFLPFLGSILYFFIGKPKGYS
jgi:hypothetical protein